MTSQEKAEQFAGKAPPLNQAERDAINALFPAYIFRRSCTDEIWTTCCRKHMVVQDEDMMVTTPERNFPAVMWEPHQREQRNRWDDAPKPTVQCPLCGKMAIVKELRYTGGRDNLSRYRRAVVLRWYRGALWARATDVPGFRDGFREQGKAIIELRSRFAPGEGVDYLLDLLSRISKDSGVATTDNGVSQTVEARQGIALKATVQLRPRVPLRPFRTFQEVEQPESEFLLRMDEEGNIGLFEADGGMWKLTARQTVKAFLEEQLAEEVAGNGVYIAL